MPQLDDAYTAFRRFYDAAHEQGELDVQTKTLIHLAVAMALGCDP